MPADPMNLELTASSDEAAASFADCQVGYFTFATDIMDRLKATLAIEPAMPMALCLRGYLMVLSRRREYLGVARRVVDTLEKQRSLLLPREAQHLDALTAFVRGDTANTLAVLEAIAREHPTDTVALRLAHFTYLYNGRSREMRDSINRVAFAWDAEQPWYGHFIAMQAFGLEEMGDYARAQRLGEEALERTPVEPWAVHAVAHCFEMQDRWAEGHAWIERNRFNWSDSGLSNHLGWHAALMCIDAGDEQGALAVLDEALARDDADMPPHITDSVALLQRLELCGIDPQGRWERVADLCAERDHDHSLVFFDAHYMLAYAGAGREAKAREMLASLDAFARASDGETATLARHSGVRLLEGLMDYKLGRVSEAYVKLAPLRYEIAHVGGSHAQRDLFHQIIIDAAIRSGHLNDALALLSERAEAAPDNALTQLRLADLLDASRMKGRGTHARERAAALRGSA